MNCSENNRKPNEYQNCFHHFILPPPTNWNLFLNFVFKLYHKICEKFYRCFGLYEKSPNSFLPGLPHGAVQGFSVLSLWLPFFLKMGIKKPSTFRRLRPVNGLIFGIRFFQTCRPQRIAAQTAQGGAPLTEQSDATLSVIKPFSADRE